MNEEQQPPRPPSGMTMKQVGPALAVGLILLVVVVLLQVWPTRDKSVVQQVGNQAMGAFGDQYLTTVVSLIELHHTRYGEYPEKLEDLRFLGYWDTAAIQVARYCANAGRDAYFVEVEYPPTVHVRLADEFWQGTGYDASLGPCDD